jgi:hypothetical protein
MRLPSSATKHSNHRSCPKPLSDSREASEPGSGSPTWAASSRESSAIEAISSNDAWRIFNEGSIEWDPRLILELFIGLPTKVVRQAQKQIPGCSWQLPDRLLQQTMVPLKHKWLCCASHQISAVNVRSGSLADIDALPPHSALPPKADIHQSERHVRLARSGSQRHVGIQTRSDQATSPLKPVSCFRNHT